MFQFLVSPSTLHIISFKITLKNKEWYRLVSGRFLVQTSAKLLAILKFLMVFLSLSKQIPG